MRRTTIGSLALVLSISLGLASCDQLFEGNFFAKATHPPVSQSDIEAKSASEIGDMLESAEYRAQLSEDPSLQAAVLARLETIYTTSADPETVQDAAMLAADFQIASDPAASFVSSAVLGAISSLSTSSVGPDDVGTIVKSLVPPDIQAEIDNLSPTPPQSFIDMIAAFQGASDIYFKLGSNLGTVTDPLTSAVTHVYAMDVPPDEALPIAVNALLSGFLAAVQTADDPPSSDPTAVANAIWKANLAPAEDAGSHLYVDPTVIQGLVSSGSYVANLLEAANFSFALGSEGGSL
ncbi:MAG: hypothetical protein Q8M76_01750 [Spirochaetaceae bacterium]|nr:hypothetical protein [Spirochaetaceae bacterium]